MKNINYIILIFAILLASCKETSITNFRKSVFTELNCTPEATPDYDGNKVTILDENKEPVKDTIINRIKKTRRVFKPCREMIYRAIWKNNDGEIITNNRIKMMATGHRWDLQPEKQDEIIIQVEYSEEDIQNTIKYQLNRKILDRRWMEQGIEGVVENVEEVWMHPFRFNQYNFTEVAPFPEVKFPLMVGKKWSGNLNILEGWGDWEHTSGNFEYEVMANMEIITNFGSIPNCWHIKSSAQYDFGKSFLEYWFNQNLGFVKMDYKNYGDQTLSIQLEGVKENASNN